jgi:3-oxoacyl-[acyl-carrier-protein] synthase III
MTAATAAQQRAGAPAGNGQPQAAPATRRAPERRRGLQAGIFGVGAAVPERVITNADLEQRLDTTDEWIVRRTGIRERRVLADGELLSDLATRACTLALEDAGRTADEVDLVIVSTITPDRLTPGVAPYVAEALGIERAGAVDVNAACAGFVYALDQAAAQIESGRARVALVCGAEALSRITDHDDRGTAPLFGDGAGAVVVAGGELELGCGGFVLGTDASQADMLYAERIDPMLRMEGREVYRHALRRMVAATSEAIERAGLTIDDVDLFVAHQANVRIIQSAASEMGLPPEKVMVNIDRVANTSSASIPLALDQAEREGRLKPGAIVALSAFGAGFVWGSGVVSWKEREHVCA